MKNKKYIALLLAFLLLNSTACGQSETAEDTGEDAISTDSTEIVSQTREYENPGIQYDGKTVTVASYNYSGTWDILKYRFDLTDENGDVVNDAIVSRNFTVEDELDIELALFSLDGNDRGSSQKLQQLILAADDAFQIGLPMNASIAPMLTAVDMLIDLKTVPTLDLSHSWWNQNANDEYTLYGKQLAAVGNICFFNHGAPIVTYFSKAMIEDHDLEDPYTLVKEGKWTQDKMIEMSEAVALDLNGNGQVEDADRFGFSGEVDSLGYLLMSAGIRLSEKDTKGDIRITINTEKTIDCVEKLVNFFYMNNVSRLQGKTELKYGSYHAEYFIPKMEVGEMLFMSNQLLVAINMRASESDFGILPSPKYNEAQEKYISFSNTWFSDHLIIPATCPDLAMTGHVIEALGYYSQEKVTPAMIEIAVVGKSIRDKESEEMVNLILDTQTFDVAYIFNWGGVRSMLSDMANNNQTNFATEYAKKETTIQTELEATVAALKGE